MEINKKEIMKQLSDIIKDRLKNDSETPETILSDLESDGFDVEDIKAVFKKMKLI